MTDRRAWNTSPSEESSSPAAAPPAGWWPPRSRSTLGKVLDIKLDRIRRDRHRRRRRSDHPAAGDISTGCSKSTNRNSWPPPRPRSSSAFSFESWRDSRRRTTSIPSASTGKDHWTAGFQHFWLKGRERKLAGDYGDYCLELQGRRWRATFRAPAARRHELCVPPRRRPVREIPAQVRGRLRRAAHRRQDRRGARPIQTSGFIKSIKLDSGDEHRGRPVHRLHRLSRPADRQCAARRLRGLVALAVLRQRRGAADRVRRPGAFPTRARSPTSPAGSGASRCSTASATAWSIAAATSRRRGGEADPAGQHRRQGPNGAARHQVPPGPAPEDLEPATVLPSAWRAASSSRSNRPAFTLSQRGITRLMQMFPSAGIRQSDIDEYNKQTWSRSSTFVTSSCCTTTSPTGRIRPFWRACRGMDIPPSLRHRIELFRETGRVFRAPNELFAENSWIQVMLGQGIVPRGSPPGGRPHG